jgi:Fe-S-cluster containining protein
VRAHSKADIEALEAIYAKLPKMRCKQKCQKACGPIFMSPLEWDRMILAAGERKGDASLVCPYLNKVGQCDAYSVRPLICRLWGTVRQMQCPHGCEPERWMSNTEARLLLREADQLSRRLGP